MIQIEIPHNLKDKTPYQLEYLGTKRKYAVLVWHRRAKKTRTALSKQVKRIVDRDAPGTAYYVLPTYRQAKQVVWDALVKEHIPAELIDKKNESELAIYYKNGVIQRFIGADNPDSHRGTNPFDVVFDEYAEMDEEIWTAIFQPVLRENKGTATFVFTPKGRNHAWKLTQTVKDNPEWFVSVKSVKDTGIFEEAELTEIQKNTPQALFEQEYLCSFLEGASQVFRNHRNCTYDPQKDRVPEVGDFRLGVDLAKYQDWTVITPFNLNTFQAYPQDRFNQVDWITQEGRIEAAYRRFLAHELVLDSTGVGDPIFDHLADKGLSINSFKFTEGSREQLLRNLSILLEQGKIRIPNDEGLLSELDSFTFELGERGRVKMKVPENMHDDRVFSLALAVWGITEPLLFVPAYEIASQVSAIQNPQ